MPTFASRLKNFFYFFSHFRLTVIPKAGIVFPAPRTRRNITMTKDILYDNGSHKVGMLFAFGENQIRVFIKTILEIDYEYEEFKGEDRRLMGQDGETSIRWAYSTMNDVDLTATIVDREGRDVFELCEARTSDHTRDRLLKMVMLEGGGTLRQMIMDEIENDGPDQECPYDCDEAWIEKLEHNERDAKDEAMAARYPEQV